MLLYLNILVWESAPKTRWEPVRHLLGPWYGRKLNQESQVISNNHTAQSPEMSTSETGKVQHSRTVERASNLWKIHEFWHAKSQVWALKGPKPGAILGGISEVQTLPLWPPVVNEARSAETWETKTSMSSQGPTPLESPYLTVLSSCQKRHNDICRKMRTLANLQATNSSSPPVIFKFPHSTIKFIWQINLEPLTLHPVEFFASRLLLQGQLWTESQMEDQKC